MEYFAVASLIVEMVPLVLAAIYRRTRTAVIYFATLPVLWFIAMELFSGHMTGAGHLLWIYPIPWIFLLVTMKRRRDEIALALDEASRSADLAQ